MSVGKHEKRKPASVVLVSVAFEQPLQLGAVTVHSISKLTFQKHPLTKVKDERLIELTTTVQLSKDSSFPMVGKTVL